jgi:hypothetical protein
MQNPKSFKPFIEFVQQAHKHLFLTKFLFFLHSPFIQKILTRCLEFEAFYMYFSRLSGHWMFQ